MKLFIVAGTKGGIGKSLTASLLADSALDAKLKLNVYDCDDENPSFSDVFRESAATVEQLAPSGEAAFPLDRLIDDVSDRSRTDEVFIADMKAGTSRSTLDWLDYVPFRELGAMGIETSVIGVVTSDVDSMLTFMGWIARLNETAVEGLVRLVAVKNRINGNNFSYYDEKLAPVIAEFPRSHTIELPALTWEYLSLCRRCHTTPGQVLRNPKIIPDLQFMQRARIRREYAIASAGFGDLLKLPWLGEGAAHDT